MSISSNQLFDCNVCPARQSSPCAAAPLAAAVRERRCQLGFGVDEAADLAGMSLSQWLALESGYWIPQERSDMRAIADALQGNITAISFLAFFSEHWSATKNGVVLKKGQC